MWHWQELYNCLDACFTYRVAQKSKSQSFVYIFVKYRPILKIFSLAHSVENLK